MATINLTRQDFKSTVMGNDMVLVDFWAEWCGPCLRFGPVYEAASTENPDFVFAKVDTEAEQELSEIAQITAIPTLMAFKEGELVFAEPGALRAADLSKVIAAIRDLDMDVVRAKRAESAQ